MKKIDNALRIFLLHITTFAALNEKDGIKAKVFKMYTSSCIHPQYVWERKKIKALCHIRPLYQLLYETS